MIWILAVLFGASSTATIAFYSALREARNDRDSWRRRADVLLEQLNTMRRDGFIVPQKHKVSGPAPDADQVGKERGEQLLRRQAYIDRAKKELRRQLPQATDRQLTDEAVRLWEQTFKQDVPE